MGGYIKTYMKNVENALKDDSTDLDELKRQHLVQLQFIQHERLVHLLVTIMCCILMFIGFLIFFVSGIRAIMIVNGLLLILCFAYLSYYFFIENAVQAMYRQYNRICLKAGGSTVNSLLDDEKLTTEDPMNTGRKKK
ncbi:MAG: hypothetical protein J6X85_03810 [Ruminococcus sp.]|nr:hypothetical protein [Ruminococcus sp.]MBQ5310582.1 hypothetical protein [Oscillospiraceae bacterium]